jgi:hypothetical protein
MQRDGMVANHAGAPYEALPYLLALMSPASCVACSPHQGWGSCCGCGCGPCSMQTHTGPWLVLIGADGRPCFKLSTSGVYHKVSANTQTTPASPPQNPLLHFLVSPTCGSHHGCCSRGPGCGCGAGSVHCCVHKATPHCINQF